MWRCEALLFIKTFFSPNSPILLFSYSQVGRRVRRVVVRGVTWSRSAGQPPGPAGTVLYYTVLYYTVLCRGDCGGTKQSPIDLVTRGRSYQRPAQPVAFTGYDKVGR